MTAKKPFTVSVIGKDITMEEVVEIMERAVAGGGTFGVSKSLRRTKSKKKPEGSAP